MLLVTLLSFASSWLLKIKKADMIFKFKDSEGEKMESYFNPLQCFESRFTLSSIKKKKNLENKFYKTTLK